MSSRNNFSDPVKREIASWSNYHCMICNKAVSRRGMPEIAHIVPASKKGPRSEYYDQYNEEFRMSKFNGLLLCPEHHIIIDNEEKYDIDYLFNLNKKYREKYELEDMVNNELYSGEKNDETNKAIDNLLKYLKMDKEELLEKVEENYSNDIEKKINLANKLELNSFSTDLSEDIECFVNFKAIKYYGALTFTNDEIGNFYFYTAIKSLYLKLSKLNSEEEKYKKMLQVLKSCCNGLNINEQGMLNYYFYICEVFLK